MPTQLALAFDAVPVTCEVQERYHSIAPCLADVRAPAEQAQALNLGYSTITRWLRDFREEGLPGLFPATHYSREPYKPERVIVQLLYFKCCAPKAGDRELARDPKRHRASFVAPYGESAVRTFLLLAARRISQTRGLSQATRPARFAAGNCAASSTRLDRNPHHRIAARLTQNCPQMAAPRPPAVSHT